MYYKIENTECEAYKKLHEMRIKELKIEEDNNTLISEKIGLNWENFLGCKGQQQFGRITTYDGFVFTEPDKVDLKTWKTHSEHKDVFVPNNRTKKGKEMTKFLTNGLNKGHWFSIVYDNIGLEHPIGRFCFPYVEICKDVIVLYLDDKTEPTDENIIEITKKEFDILMS